MSIDYAILGLLSWQPLTGYDLKKIFADSTILYWSGNNNQIYRALVNLHERGLVSREIQHQEKTPSRKIYSITDTGREELSGWVCSETDLPTYKNVFLTRVMWADQLSEEELNQMFDQYQEKLQDMILMKEEQIRRGGMSARTEREKTIWDMVEENDLDFYRHEILWLKKLRTKLVKLA